MSKCPLYAAEAIVVKSVSLWLVVAIVQPLIVVDLHDLWQHSKLRSFVHVERSGGRGERETRSKRWNPHHLYSLDSVGRRSSVHSRGEHTPWLKVS